MPHTPQSQMRLYDARSNRLYINASERVRFLHAADGLHARERAFCYVLAFTGCRISEALNLTAAAIQSDARLITFGTLKRRKDFTPREVPIPHHVLQLLEDVVSHEEGMQSQPLWQVDGRQTNRTTAYRWVKSAMATAGITGAQACPKGLRHGFGVQAIRSGVPLNMLQKWMGHASMETTAIYANAQGAEELAIADRMWIEKPPPS